MQEVDWRLVAIPGAGMILVAALSIALCKGWAGSKFRWMWVGAGLWFVAVALKLVCAILANQSIFALLERSLSHFWYVALGSMYVGVSSAVFEIGLTFVAVMIWRDLGRSADRAIGIGVGAGAFEAALLGVSSAASAVVLYMGLPGSDEIGKALQASSVHASALWLVPIVERVLAISCHASSRALVLLGVTHRKPLMILAGGAIFAYIDSVAGFAHLSGALTTHSVWWIELAILPAALVSIPVLRWCSRVFPIKSPLVLTAEGTD